MSGLYFLTLDLQSITMLCVVVKCFVLMIIFSMDRFVINRQRQKIALPGDICRYMLIGIEFWKNYLAFG